MTNSPECCSAATEDETGWIIEKDDPPVYHLISADYDEHWTSDVDKALRFARKEDAGAYVDHVGWTSPPVRTAEHMWVAPRVVRWDKPVAGAIARGLAKRLPAYADPNFKYNEATGSYHRITDDAQSVQVRSALTIAREYISQDHGGFKEGDGYWEQTGSILAALDAAIASQPSPAATVETIPDDVRATEDMTLALNSRQAAINESMARPSLSAGTVQHTCRVLDGGIDGPYNEPDPACCSGRALEARDTFLRVLKRYGGEPYSHVAIDAAWNAVVATLNEPQEARKWPRVFNVKRCAENGWHGEISFARCPSNEELEALEIFLRDDHQPAPSVTRPQSRTGKVCAYHDGCPPDGPVCHLCAHLQPGAGK